MRLSPPDARGRREKRLNAPFRRHGVLRRLRGVKRKRKEAGPGLELRPARTDPEEDGATSTWDPEKLYERVRTRIRARHLSPRTERTYLSWIRRYLAFYGYRDPAVLDRRDVEAFIEQLAVRNGLGPDSQNQALASIVFLYREVFGVDFGGREGVCRAKRSAPLPRYAPPDEVDRVLSRLTGPKLVAAMVMYGSGTRVSETANLRIKDLSLGTGELTVRAGKGAKDRTTVIPRAAIPLLRAQIQRVEEQHVADLEAGHGWVQLPAALHRKDPRAGWDLGWQFVLPATRLSADPKTGRRGRAPLHVSSIQRAVKRAVREAGVHHPVTCHVLRHCFATEMLRSGCDIRLLQRLMGHRDLKTTSRYLHIIQRPGLNVVSPLDSLPSIRAAVEAEEDRW